MANEARYFKSYWPLLVAAILTAACAWFIPATMAAIEAKIDDHIWKIIGNQGQLEQRVVVIDIDEEAVARYGAWPWPRERVAELASKAKQNGVSMLIYDMVFPAAKHGDALLSEGFQQVPTVLAQILAIQANDDTQVGVLKSGLEDPKCATIYPAANAVIANNAVLALAASSAGHITPNIDSDGVIRSVPSIICYAGKSYPALALASMAEGYGQSPDFGLIENSGWWSSPNIVRNEGLSTELSIPVNAQGSIHLPWWLPRNSIISISANDLLDGVVPDSVLEGKWAIVGSTAFGAGDSVVTPQGKIVGGLEVHVQLISALLDNRVPFVPRIANLLQLLVIVLMGALLGVSANVKGRKIVYVPLLVAVLLSFFALLMHALILRSEYMLIPWVYGALFCMMSGLLIALSGYAASRRESDVLYQNLSSYLPLHAARWIATQQPIGELDARHEKVLVLHADLRNFSAWCNHLPAEQAGAVLHAFYTFTGGIIQKMGGDVEEYVGDAVTAVWRGDQADKRALQAANEMISQGEELLGNQTTRDEVPPLAIGIGIEYGDVLAGAFGPSQRRTYTVIGEAVTKAMQLQNLTSDLAVPILIGETAAKQWLAEDYQGCIHLESLGEFLLQDANKPMIIYTPAETTDSTN
ncbi:MAG: adenylate/guanylate cyclase domain-containing protein [Cycloclasticus sp.]